MSYWKAQQSSKLGRAIVTQVTTALVNASASTTNFGSQTYQVRIVHNISAGIWATISDRYGSKLSDMVADQLARVFCRHQT